MSERPPALADRSPSTIGRELGLLIRGEIRTDPFALSMYATDSSIYEIEPLAVVYPLDEDDVRTCMWFACQHSLPIIARGAGTGLTGECLGRAIIMDLNVHMARIIELDRQNQTVVVEAGVVLDSLNRALKPYGFRIGVNPMSASCCTVGGMIANNAHGTRSLKFGTTRDMLISARAVLPDGSVTNFRPIPLSGPVHERKCNEPGLAGKINKNLPELLKAHAGLFEQKGNRADFDRCGYMVEGVLQGDSFDPSRLICGSEGTLAVVSEAVLKVEPLAEATGLALVYFEDLARAADAVKIIKESSPVSCELMDHMLMALAREAHPELVDLYPEDAGALLAVEYESNSSVVVGDHIASLEVRLGKDIKPLLFRSLRKEGTQEEFWKSRKSAMTMLYHREDGLQPVPIVEDAAVPVDRLSEFIRRGEAVFEKYGLLYTAYGHAGHGAPHLRPLMDLRQQVYIDLMEPVATEIHKIAKDCEGTISGGYGEGLARAQFVQAHVGEEKYNLFKEIKNLFDPTGILNPDKKITDDGELLTKNLKYGAGYKFSDGRKPKQWSIDPTQATNRIMFKSQTAVTNEMTVEYLADNPTALLSEPKALLNWGEGEMARICEKENGYMLSRATGSESEMAARFRYNRIEDACPRTWVNIFRRMMTGRQKQGAFSSPEMIEIMDYCWNTKLVGDDSPTAPDISKLVMEAKARYYQGHEIEYPKKILMQSEFWCGLGQLFAPLVNTLNDLPSFRLLLQCLIGVDSRRPLPHFKDLRLRHQNTYGPDGPRPKVVLYQDLYTRFFAPEIAQAAVDVLEHSGHEVVVPEVSWTNWPAIAHGAVLLARNQIRKVTSELAYYAFKGYPILVMEPTDLLCLKRDYLSYLDIPESRAVARHAQDLCGYLAALKQAGRLETDFKEFRVTFGYHQTPHHRALRIGQPGLELIKQLPGVTVDFEDATCSGMMGGFGLMKKYYDESMWIGRSVFRRLSKSPAKYGLCDSNWDAEQLRHGSGKPVLHPIQVLAASYGFGAAKSQDYGYQPMDIREPAHHVDREEVLENAEEQIVNSH